MARQTTPAQSVESNFAMLRRLTRNLLIDNKNFVARRGHGDFDCKPSHYAETYPRTADFIDKVLKGFGETLIEKIDEIGVFARDMADVVGLDEATNAQLIAELEKRGIRVAENSEAVVHNHAETDCAVLSMR